MRRDDELIARNQVAQPSDQTDLPVGIEVKLGLVDQDDPRGCVGVQPDQEEGRDDRYGSTWVFAGYQEAHRWMAAPSLLRPEGLTRS